MIIESVILKNISKASMTEMYWNPRGSGHRTNSTRDTEVIIKSKEVSLIRKSKQKFTLKITTKGFSTILQTIRA
jgi:hypothetical protein